MSEYEKKASPDKIYQNPQNKVDDFSFNRQVVDVFPDMIERSIPGYAKIIDGVGRLAAKFTVPKSNVYDLGCSLGAVSLSIAKHNQQHDIQIIGVDNSSAMVERCQRHVDSYTYANPIHIKEADIVDFDLNNASVIVMNFTLQFIQPKRRDALMIKLFDALIPGGVLILSEKIKLSHEVMDSAIVDLHHDFKRENGYSDLEISQKRTALENVMILDEYSLHQKRLLKTGFEAVSIWYQQLNFVSFFAIKGQ
ncbi:carboxy-S-adenosyl-L-methionine synthase CmoA [Brumicola pallidula]|jgi:tRNA (cmo5U34)-methyltransferase|uniref:Carboxy-S-adenosyl-L-methionine synthase n=1 Tax=Brumicola pallidula DSM 14239 = ACAM 615 TaxID=1121922 RepID=K6ZKE8_9ALTE|nr:carboxy-S-adenosyl-L-methionine synthase CmoA [Glaciecola pallidula]GAC29363.1 tRNA (cmo5U34)-methyltransferase [Glaciecola pallidula DSM 14239 = ACAM 615]